MVLDGAAATLRVTAFEVELDSLGEPVLKAALKECLATAKVATAQLAAPPDVATPAHNVVDPSAKLTVPRGVPAADVVVEVKVSVAPNVPGVGEAASVVVVVAAVIFSVCDAEVTAVAVVVTSDAVMVGVPAVVSP